eukprot:1751445-Rhodomonas_salina.1
MSDADAEGACPSRGAARLAEDGGRRQAQAALEPRCAPTRTIMRCAVPLEDAVSGLERERQVPMRVATPGAENGGWWFQGRNGGS